MCPQGRCYVYWKRPEIYRHCLQQCTFLKVHNNAYLNESRRNEAVNNIHLAEDRVRWCVLAANVSNIPVPHRWGIYWSISRGSTPLSYVSCKSPFAFMKRQRFSSPADWKTHFAVLKGRRRRVHANGNLNQMTAPICYTSPLASYLRSECMCARCTSSKPVQSTSTEGHTSFVPLSPYQHHDYGNLKGASVSWIIQVRFWNVMR
jgi:hypothetical protein